MEELRWRCRSSESSELELELELEVMDEVEEVETVLGLRGRGRVWGSLRMMVLRRCVLS